MYQYLGLEVYFFRNLFYILCGHFHEKKIGGTTLPGVGVDATFSVFRHFNSPFWKKNICTLWCLNLQNMLELPFSFCISKKPGEILIFRTFVAKFGIFVYFSQKKKVALFRSGMFLWRHNYVTPWPYVLILVCMNREGPYLPIDTKINFIGSSIRKI